MFANTVQKGADKAGWILYCTEDKKTYNKKELTHANVMSKSEIEQI